jgi:hypothetical protein
MEKHISSNMYTLNQNKVKATIQCSNGLHLSATSRSNFVHVHAMLDLKDLKAVI